MDAGLPSAGLDRGVDLTFRRADDLGHLSGELALGHAFDALANHTCSLAHLFHADHVAVPGITVRADRHTELELTVCIVWDLTTNVPPHTGRAQVRAGQTVCERDIAIDRAHTFDSALEDLVPAQERVMLLEIDLEAVEELQYLLVYTDRQVCEHPAWADVVEHHASAADSLEDVEQLLAVADRVEELTHRARVQAERPVPHQVACDTGDLCDHRPDPARLGRQFDL